MLISLLFLWAEVVATACYTQNRSIIRLRHGKTPYELLHDKLPDLSFFHVFGALCYPTNDSENLGKLQPKADIGIFIGYAPTKKAFQIYNRRTRRIIETIHVDFDKLTAMASEHSSSGPALHEMTPATISSGLVPNPPPSTPFVPPSRTDWDMLFQPLFDELLNPPPSVDHPAPEVVAPIDEKGDDPIDAINHTMSFLTAVFTSRYPTTNNQLRKSSNPRQQATINDGRLTVQPVQGRHISYAADPRIPEGQATQTVITHNVAYQADDLDAYDSDCDELNTAKVALMANLSLVKVSDSFAEVKKHGHNLFSIGKFCDSNLEVTFRQHTCFIRNLEGVDLLTGSRGNNLYTLSLGDMMASSPIYLLSKASKTKSWLCHRHNGTEFVNQTLRRYYEKVGISHETSVARSPQQNGVVERRNRTLIEAARTMLIYTKAPLFLWAEAVATACYTQNRSIIRPSFTGKTPYELLHDKPPELSFLHVFGALCYLANDSENLAVQDTQSNEMILHHQSVSDSCQTLLFNTVCTTLRTDWDILFQPLFDELLTPPPSVDHPAPEVIALIAEVVAPEPAASTGSPSSTTVDQDAPSPSNSQTIPKTQSPIIPNDVEEDNHDIEVVHMGNDPYFGIPIPKIDYDQSSSSDSIHTIMHPDHQISEHNSK
ncbi:integrase, catalytic region, zinc finger, CCHC-type containing protein [Tanacetum coccineum]